MQIDRTRFLMLTTSIAAGACAGAPAGTPEVPEQTVIVIAPPPAFGSATPAPPPAEEPPVEEPEAVEEMTPHALEEVDDEPSLSAIASAPATCGNQRGNPAQCTGLRAPGPQCESFHDTLADCHGFRRALQPRIAEKAIQCLLAKSGKREICSFDVAVKCANSASKDACIDSFSGPPCRTAVAQCASVRGNKLTMQRCQQVLSSVAPRFRRAMITCITEDCGVDYCFSMIR